MRELTEEELQQVKVVERLELPNVLPYILLVKNVVRNTTLLILADVWNTTMNKKMKFVKFAKYQR